jgi:hypothetical protein
MASAHFACHGGATSANKGYNAAPEYRLGLRHIAQKTAQRRIAKTLCESAVQTFKAGVLARSIINKFIALYLIV